MAARENVVKEMGKVVLSVGIGFGSLAVLAFLKRTGLLYRMLHKVDIRPKNHGGELVADVLKAHGVKYLFTLAGGHISPLLVACEKLNIRVIDTRHEVNAVFAADAVARLSGMVGVAAVTAGPGLTNTVTAVKNAQMAESPVLLIGGAAPVLLKNRGALQDIDQMALFKPLCKYCCTVKYVRDIVPAIRKALQIAQSDTPGPVFVEIPADVLHPYEVVSKSIGIQANPKGLTATLVNWYLTNYLYNLYAGAWKTWNVSPLPVSQPIATKSDIQRCAKLVSKAKRPLLLLGSQCVLPPTPVEQLRSALEHLGIPCFLGGMARGLLGKNSSIHMRQKRRDALRQADVIILAGAVCDFRLDYGRVLNKKATIVAVNRNKEQLFKNSDMFWKPTVALQADAGTFIKQLSELLVGYSCPSEWIQELRERDSQKEKETAKMAEQVTDVHLNPLKVLLKVEDVMADESVIVADGGDFVGSAAYILRPRGPLTWLDPGAFGTLGVGGGFALGAKLSRPESEVWIIYGDGSLGYSIAEFDTFTRHQVPVIALVGNDACWTQIAREQVPMFNSSVACNLAFMRYDTVAEGYGGKGFILDRSNEDKMEEVLREAQKLCKQGHSVLINCLIGKTKFREGSISV